MAVAAKNKKSTVKKKKAVLKFEDAEFQSLPLGSHEPCELVSVDRREPDEKQLERFPDSNPYFCFKFTLRDPDSELHEHEAVRMCSETASKMGNLFAFCIDLEGGTEPEDFDPERYVGRTYRVKVRKRQQSDKLQVESCELLDPAGESPF